MTSAVESVWAALGPSLDAATADLARCTPLAAGLGAETEAEARAVSADLQALRAATNADPLALWQPDPAGPPRAAAPTPPPPTGCASAWPPSPPGSPSSTGCGSRPGAASTGSPPPWRAPAPTARKPSPRGGRPRRGSPRCRRPRPTSASRRWPDWTPWRRAASGSRLAAELERCEADLAASGAKTAELRQAAEAALDKRDELRGLLRAYKAKAARLGAAEDEDLAGRYEQAYRLLWTAPCDLPAAEAAVADYQRAILAKGRQ